MTDCPGYLSIKIFDRQESEGLFRYDLLVSCPPSFNLSFIIPTLGVKLDKTFDVLFSDAKKEFRVFLTYLWYQPFQLQPDNPASFVAAAATDTKANPRLSLSVVLLITSSCVVVLFVAYITADFTSQYRRTNKEPTPDAKDDCDGFPKSKTAFPILHCSRPNNFRSLNSSRRFAIVVYLSLKICFSLTFTFTAMTLILNATLFQNYFDILLDIREIRLLYDERKSKIYDSYEIQIHDRLESHQGRVFKMCRACHSYLDELVETMQTHIDQTSTEHRPGTFAPDNYPISRTVREHFWNRFR